jgi:hypothetical protein
MSYKYSINPVINPNPVSSNYYNIMGLSFAFDVGGGSI